MYGKVIKRCNVNYIFIRTKFWEIWKNRNVSKCRQTFTMTNNMTPSGLLKMLHLQKLYKLQIAPVLCNMWQMRCHVDNMADGKAM